MQTQDSEAATGCAQGVLVSYSGGVFHSGEIVLNASKTKVAELSGCYPLPSSLCAPEVGAALYPAGLNPGPIVAKIELNSEH